MTELLDGKIYKSNALVEAAYTLTMAEQKIILAAITQVRRDEPVTDEVRYAITANALADMAGFVAKHEYRALKAATEKLWERTLTVHAKSNGAGPVIQKMRWIQEAIYKQDEGAVEIRFSKPILPYLNQLSTEFTKYRFEHVAGMRSSYGIRLYELLVQWRSEGEREIEVDWLRQQWELTDKYPSIKDFKKWVIDPAVKDVNAHSDLWVKQGQRKTGRTVTHLQFQFGPKDTPKAAKPKALPSSPKISGIPKREIERRARPGETYEQAANRIASKKRGQT
ncbi:MAG: replication initiation protein [Bdellovibrionales bacterium]